MCIAILNTEKTISKKTLQICWDNNPHGAGLAYPENGVMKTHKELKSFKSFYKYYEQKRKENPDVNMLIHFRIATHGRINETNCHPFLVNNSLAFIHNGVISNSHLGVSDDFSDTYLFNQNVLKKLPKGFSRNEAILSLLCSYIGGSKLIFLDANNKWAIVNELSGCWDGGNWFSNKTYSYDDYDYNFNFGLNGKHKHSKKGKGATCNTLSGKPQWGSYYDDYEENYGYGVWNYKEDYCKECHTPISTNESLCRTCKEMALDAGFSTTQIDEYYNIKSD